MAANTGAGTRVRPLVRKIDCIRLRVADLASGLAFYRDHLGHELIWRTEDEAGLRMPDDGAEIVIQARDPWQQEIDLLVESADSAAARFRDSGGTILVAPFDIRIGRAAVVKDPWGNQLVLLDASKGLLVTDSEGRIVGNAKPSRRRTSRSARRSGNRSRPRRGR